MKALTAAPEPKGLLPKAPLRAFRVSVVETRYQEWSKVFYAEDANAAEDQATAEVGGRYRYGGIEMDEVAGWEEDGTVDLQREVDDVVEVRDA